jgi:hypothetical protein
MGIVRSFFRSSDKEWLMLGESELLEVPYLEEASRMDQLWVRMAATVAKQKSAVTITTDGPLRTAIEQCGWMEAYGFRVESPDGALVTIGNASEFPRR